MDKTYLIRCKKVLKGREVKYHLDWGWSPKFHKRVWTYSVMGNRGYECKGLLRPSHMKCLFHHFGLTGYKHNPKYKGVLGMSPAKLFRLRRKRERTEGGSMMFMMSDRIGERYGADDVH